MRDARALPRLARDCRLAVFDLDGTLYEQGPVRRRMMAELLTAPAAEGRLFRLNALRRYRHLREAEGADPMPGFEDRILTRLASETGRPREEIRALVSEWMERRPLRRLRAARVRGAGRLFAGLRAKGVRVAVWSDYPVADKLAALDLDADDTASAGDADVGRLKPDPAGLRVLLDRAGCTPSEAVMIGDRESRDGEAARALGVAFLLRQKGGALPDFVALADSLA